MYKIFRSYSLNLNLILMHSWFVGVAFGNRNTSNYTKLTLIPICIGKSLWEFNVERGWITGTSGSGQDIILSAWKNKQNVKNVNSFKF